MDALKRRLLAETKAQAIKAKKKSKKNSRKNGGLKNG
jgi:hypothetical protein